MRARSIAAVVDSADTNSTGSASGASRAGAEAGAGSAGESSSQDRLTETQPVSVAVGPAPSCSASWLVITRRGGESAMADLSVQATTTSVTPGVLAIWAAADSMSAEPAWQKV